MNNNYLPESEWDGAGFHQLRLHLIRTNINNSLASSDWKTLHNYLSIYKNELIMVMQQDDLDTYNELMKKAQSDYNQGHNPSEAYDNVLEHLTIVLNRGGLGIKRKISLKGATGRR